MVGLTEPERVAQVASLEGAELVLLDMKQHARHHLGRRGNRRARAAARRRSDAAGGADDGLGTVDRAVEAMKLGAADYVTKPWG